MVFVWKDRRRRFVRCRSREAREGVEEDCTRFSVRPRLAVERFDEKIRGNVGVRFQDVVDGLVPTIGR